MNLDHTTNDSIVKLCECGCGQPTEQSIKTGQPKRFARGHGGAAGIARPERRSPIDRFWGKVDRSGGPDACWIWTAGKDKKGYGQFGIGYKKYFAHRFSYEIHHGPIPEDMNVCHNCPDGDNPACVNPAHLWLGTQRENLDDSIAKGRFHKPQGQHYRGANFTDEQVKEFRRQYANLDVSIMEFARLHNVHPGNMWKIIRRLSYKHVSP